MDTYITRSRATVKMGLPDGYDGFTRLRMHAARMEEQDELQAFAEKIRAALD